MPPTPKAEAARAGEPETASTLIRARVFHTPRNPFRDEPALECHENGAVVFAEGHILATGDFAGLAAAHPGTTLIDEREAFLLPGLVDTHVLESCASLAAELDAALVTSHVNENGDEIAVALECFPHARDYLAVYERHGLVGPRTVLAHNVHPTDAELARMAPAGASVAHCSSSNGFLGSGIFPMARHLRHGVRFALGTDVGAGTGLSVLKEGLAAYQGQMIARDRMPLTPAHLLWLSTRAGAEILGLGDLVGDLAPGREADLVLLRPPAGSTLEAALARCDSAEAALGALFTLAREESVAATWVAGEQVHSRM